MSIVIDKIELLALKKLALVCSAIAETLQDGSAKREQRTLTHVLVDVITRAELDHARKEDAA